MCSLFSGLQCMKAYIHTSKPVQAVLCGTSSRASPSPAVFRILILSHFLVMTRFFFYKLATGVGRWPGFSKLHRQSSCLAWLVWGGSVSWLFVFLVLLLLSLAHQHFLPQEPTGSQLFPLFQVVLSPLLPVHTFPIPRSFVGRAKVISKWVRGGMSCLLPLLFFMEEVATSLCGFIWFGSAALGFWNIIPTVHYQPLSWYITVDCRSQVHSKDKERFWVNI